MSKITEIGQCFTELLNKQKWPVFMDHTVEGNTVFA